MLLNGCGKSVYTTIASFETNNAGEKFLTYNDFDGTREYSFEVREGIPATIDVSFVTEGGSLEVRIAKDGEPENAEYAGNDIPTSSFTLTISEPGSYIIHLEAEHHKGSYSFVWQ